MTTQLDIFTQGTFHNTTDLKGKVLSEAKQECKNLESKIVKLYQLHSNLSPSQAYLRLSGKHILTSVRRAITNLTMRDKLLTKTDVKITGMYGKPEYVWTLKTESV